MRTFQTPTLTISEPAPRCPKCGAEILLGHQVANADRYYPIAVIRQQDADPDSGVRWVWNEGVYVDKKPSWLYWLFGFQWLPCPHCGEKLSRLGREKDLSVYPVVELPPASAQAPAALGVEPPREQPAPADEDVLNHDSIHDRSTGLPNRGSGMMKSSELKASVKLLIGKASRYATYGANIALIAIVIATALASYYETGAVTLTGLIEAQKTNPVLWLLDIMPFLFAFWGQYVSSAMAYEASAMVIDQISELRGHTTAIEQKTMHDATHDHLTDLPNRVLLRDRLELALNVAQRDKSRLAVLMMDLDRFKEINDTLGHYNGDRLLKQVAARLQGTVQDTDTVARLGGDEFAILLLNTGGIKEAAEVARKIGNALHEAPFNLEGLKLAVQASIGIAVFPDHGPDADTLLQRADVAMYIAKQQKSGYAIYDPRLDKHSPHRLVLMAELRHAIDADELVLHYQPKVNVKTRQVTAVEALVRWQHPKYDLLGPEDFIPLAERTVLIKPLTLWVLKHALRQQDAWKKEGLDIGVAVNMSAHGLLDLELPDLIAGLLTNHQVSADRLILEITGTSVISDEKRALQILTRLTDMGVQLALDDFGTGYSRLDHLSRLPVREVKIDKSYVLDMIENDKHAMIVRATIDLAHNLGLDVIGEGAANEEIFTELEKLGCDAVQGAYISQALSAEDFSRWIQDSPWSPRQIS